MENNSDSEAALSGRIGTVLRLGYGFRDGEMESAARAPSGRVNDTFIVATAGRGRAILQRLNPHLTGLAENVGENLSRVNAVLAGSGVGSPRIMATAGGGWIYNDPTDGSFWRLTSFLPGRAPDRASPGETRLAGELLGRCHVAMNRPMPMDLLDSGLEGGNNTNRRLCLPGDFDDLLLVYRGHPNLPGLREDIVRGSRAAGWLPARHEFRMVFLGSPYAVHLDCKLDNFLLDGGRGSIIDWDSVGYGDPLLDLGEMFRSWATTSGERLFDAEVAGTILDGYRRTGPEMDRERYGLLPATVRAIALNLARRYLTDALAEVYFRWDSSAYPSLHEQNRLRGRRMLDLVDELMDREIELMRL